MFTETLLKSRLRTRLLISFAAISTLLTWGTLFVVRYRVQLQVRQDIDRNLQNSLATFQSLQTQRDDTLAREAALLASQPLLKALMTSRDTTTIQDASTGPWRLVGSELFVLADRFGNLVGLHTASPGFNREEAARSLAQTVASHELRSWWFGGGRLYQVFFQPIYFGSENDTPIGLLGLGFEINERLAAEVGRVASNRIAFQYGGRLVVSTVSPLQKHDLETFVRDFSQKALEGRETVQFGSERFQVASIRLQPESDPEVRLTVLESYDRATAFLASLNQLILALGILAVVIGSALVYALSTTFTRPLAKLVDGVHALEKNDFEYPLDVSGADEVSEVTAAFDRMRRSLLETQRRLIEQERLATIGRMASNISHDLRHPLTAILAYAEFLADSSLQESQRHDFYQEIRIAVNRMTDEISSLVGFSKQGATLRQQSVDVVDVIHRAVQTVKVLRDFQTLSITYVGVDGYQGWFDPGKLERVILNLLFNACEVVSADTGMVRVDCRPSKQGVEIRVEDNGPGIPESIRETLFEPFVSYGKEKGIGLGLTVVQRLVQEHGGDVSIERTGPGGTVFLVYVPSQPPHELTRILTHLEQPGRG